MTPTACLNHSTCVNQIKAILLFALILVVAILRATPSPAAGTETLTVAGGCFWCVESDFESVPGVVGAVSGFTGGASANPSYDQVSKGGTGHYEAVQITFDPSRVSRETLLNMFFRSVDPTDAGGQFCDRGESYRTAIFVSNAGEKRLAEAAKDNAQRALGQTVVTPILSQSACYPAEADHQDYYKGEKLVFTRVGAKRQKDAYKA